MASSKKSKTTTCVSGQRFNPALKKKGGSGCYVSKSKPRKACSKGTHYHKASKSCKKPCALGSRRSPKTFKCVMPKKKKTMKKSKGGVAFIA